MKIKDIKLYIDAGHGGVQPGATYKGRLEKNDTLRLAKAVDSYARSIGMQTMMSRTGDTTTDINRFVARANAWGATYLLSIHRNAFLPEQARGVEGWVVTGANSQTVAKAKAINDNLVKLGFVDRGIKKGSAKGYANYGVNSLSWMASVLMEVGFIDNSGDNRIYDNKLNEIAKGIVDAIVATHSNEKAPTPKPVQSKTTPKQAPTKSLARLAQEVLDGKWGNGDDRKKRLTSSGYDYNAVQREVNKRLYGTAQATQKSINEVVNDVLAGKYGNGDARRRRLSNEGYDPNVVQQAVNERLYGKPEPKKASISDIVTQVLAGQWGNGTDRRNRLEKAGYNYNEVQRAVNKRLYG